MTAPATEKAASIPAEVLALAERFATMQYGGREPNTKGWQKRRDWFARAIMQDRADRASQEERIREDEREACAKVVDDFGVTWGASYRSMTDEIAKAVRARQWGGASTKENQA